MEPTAVEDIAAGNLVIRPRDFLIQVDGRTLALTMREFQLLVALARREGRVVPRDELYTIVWQQPFRQYERSVDVYVAKVRQKLEEAAPGWRYIHTHFGFGYRFEPSPLV